MWNLEKWYRQSYLPSRNKDTNVKNKYMETKGERWGVRRRNWDIGIDTYILLILRIK